MQINEEPAQKVHLKEEVNEPAQMAEARMQKEMEEVAVQKELGPATPRRQERSRASRARFIRSCSRIRLWTTVWSWRLPTLLSLTRPGWRTRRRSTGRGTAISSWKNSDLQSKECELCLKLSDEKLRRGKKFANGRNSLKNPTVLSSLDDFVYKEESEESLV